MLAALVTLGCNPTNFQGSAKYPGGARGCFDACKEGGMKMGAFVFAGEYSTACVCEPLDPPTGGAKQTAGGIGPAAVGVVLQARASQQAHQPYSSGR